MWLLGVINISHGCCLNFPSTLGIISDLGVVLFRMGFQNLAEGASELSHKIKKMVKIHACDDQFYVSTSQG